MTSRYLTRKKQFLPHLLRRLKPGQGTWLFFRPFLLLLQAYPHTRNADLPPPVPSKTLLACHQDHSVCNKVQSTLLNFRVWVILETSHVHESSRNESNPRYYTPCTGWRTKFNAFRFQPIYQPIFNKIISEKHQNNCYTLAFQCY